MTIRATFNHILVFSISRYWWRWPCSLSQHTHTHTHTCSDTGFKSWESWRRLPEKTVVFLIDIEFLASLDLGSHGCKCQDYGGKGCDVVQFGRQTTVFRRKPLRSCSGLQSAGSSVMFISPCRTTRCHIPQNRTGSSLIIKNQQMHYYVLCLF
jgi:hypothetical protein